MSQHEITVTINGEQQTRKNEDVTSCEIRVGEREEADAVA